MADSETPEPISEEELDNGDNGEDYIDDDDFEEEEEEEEPQEMTPESRLRAERNKLDNLFHRLSTERVTLRVHDVLIKGNTKTKDSIIEAQIESLFRNANSMQELLQAASLANARLQMLDIFDFVNITLDSGPQELPGTANVVVEVTEAKNPLTGDIGIFSKPEAKSWSLEGSLKYKNLLGYGDKWDGSWAYGWDQTSEVSAGVHVPKFKGFKTPVTARASLLSQDWLKFSSYKDRALGLSLGLVSTRHHDLAYGLTWRTLMDPSQMASATIRRQLGHALVSSLKYTFKIDKRNSPVRPTKGYAFVSSTHIGGLSPDSRVLKFMRQEFDVRYALPLGFFHSAINFGVSAGVLFPWGSGSMHAPTLLPERFFLGGNASAVCSLGGPTTVMGFKSRGLGPTEHRRQIKDKSGDENSDNTGRDALGGDFAVTAFADLSFNLPLKVLREAGIHGHLFATTGNIAQLSGNEFKNFSLQKFQESFRTSAGIGIVVPTRLFRMEVRHFI
ncbi:Bacterial surface antigen (D15) [Dillenia turbinata]|uniref:Bacterial surface antigen (D15) n=1 Tax=Dillenia turbinata TaxID=194707 RepID=A0AAN8VGT0_9MAGN